jgi:hypothetical protein
MERSALVPDVIHDSGDESIELSELEDLTYLEENKLDDDFSDDASDFSEFHGSATLPLPPASMDQWNRKGLAREVLTLTLLALAVPFLLSPFQLAQTTLQFKCSLQLVFGLSFLVCHLYVVQIWHNTYLPPTCRGWHTFFETISLTTLFVAITAFTPKWVHCGKGPALRYVVFLTGLCGGQMMFLLKHTLLYRKRKPYIQGLGLTLSAIIPIVVLLSAFSITCFHLAIFDSLQLSRIGFLLEISAWYSAGFCIALLTFTLVRWRTSRPHSDVTLRVFQANMFCALVPAFSMYETT